MGTGVFLGRGILGLSRVVKGPGFAVSGLRLSQHGVVSGTSTSSSSCLSARARRFGIVPGVFCGPNRRGPRRVPAAHVYALFT